MSIIERLKLKRDLCDAMASALAADPTLKDDHRRLETATLDHYCERHGALSPVMIEIIIAIIRVILSNM